MRVLQEFVAKLSGGIYEVSFSRFPNGHGVIDRVLRVDRVLVDECAPDEEPDERERRVDVTTLLPETTRNAIEHAADRLWEDYWTCDPRTHMP
jgi:hypothetical protein